jgi:hypothetical protein
LLIDIYYYLDKSSKRNLELKNCQLMCEIKAHKILKHVATRWLSLGKCLDRLFEQWDALNIFFKQEFEIEKKNKEKVKRRLRLSLYQPPNLRLKLNQNSLVLKLKLLLLPKLAIHLCLWQSKRQVMFNRSLNQRRSLYHQE